MFGVKSALLTILLTMMIVAAVYFATGSFQPRRDDALQVVESYLKATYARDYRDAYRHISSLDQNVINETSYVEARGAFDGFTRQLARKIAGYMDLWVIEQTTASDRANIRIGYRVPAAEDLSNLLFNWDPDKLNSLAGAAKAPTRNPGDT